MRLAEGLNQLIIALTSSGINVELVAEPFSGATLLGRNRNASYGNAERHSHDDYTMGKWRRCVRTATTFPAGVNEHPAAVHVLHRTRLFPSHGKANRWFASSASDALERRSVHSAAWGTGGVGKGYPRGL
jgi:hypothetical protein